MATERVPPQLDGMGAALRPSKMQHPAYADMLTVAKLMVRKSFRTDLTVHDKRALHQHDNTRERPFVWAAHEGGTFLCWVDVKSIDGKGHTPADFVRFVEESFGGCEWYLWDGVSLQTCSAEGAADYARTFEWCAHV